MGDYLKEYPEYKDTKLQDQFTTNTIARPYHPGETIFGEVTQTKPSVLDTCTCHTTPNRPAVCSIVPQSQESGASSKLTSFYTGTTMDLNPAWSYSGGVWEAQTGSAPSKVIEPGFDIFGEVNSTLDSGNLLNEDIFSNVQFVEDWNAAD
jgi:hypothetical protein